MNTSEEHPRTYTFESADRRSTRNSTAVMAWSRTHSSVAATVRGNRRSNSRTRWIYVQRVYCRYYIATNGDPRSRHLFRPVKLQSHNIVVIRSQLRKLLISVVINYVKCLIFVYYFIIGLCILLN